MSSIVPAVLWVLCVLFVPTIFSFLYLLDEDVRDYFRRHIVRCVVEDKCPARDSRIHVALERVLWFFIAQGGVIRGALCVWVFAFFSELLFPLSKAEIAIRKIR